MRHDRRRRDNDCAPVPGPHHNLSPKRTRPIARLRFRSPSGRGAINWKTRGEIPCEMREMSEMSEMSEMREMSRNSRNFRPRAHPRRRRNLRKKSVVLKHAGVIGLPNGQMVYDVRLRAQEKPPPYFLDQTLIFPSQPPTQRAILPSHTHGQVRLV